MTDPQAPLKAFRKTQPFFIGVDSDGCAFDTMEIKHKECFGPNTVKHFRLQPVAKMAREAFEFVNLYGKTRGCNRWVAAREVLRLLRERPEVAERGVAIPPWKGLDAFLESGCTLSDDGLKEFIGRCPDPSLADELLAMWDWTRAVNRSVADMVEGVPPFPFVRESLQKAAAQADLMVVSATPTEALEREWKEHGLAEFMSAVAGQEMGAKAEHLDVAAKGKYPPENILMVGDALGDRKAAQAAGARFYPILPGDEARSWMRFFEEGLERFFAGEFAGEYERRLAEEFDACLPERPPWVR